MLTSAAGYPAGTRPTDRTHEPFAIMRPRHHLCLFASARDYEAIAALGSQYAFPAHHARAQVARLFRAAAK